MIFIQKRCPLSTLNALFSKFYMASVMASLEELMQARHRCILGCRLQGRLVDKTPTPCHTLWATIHGNPYFRPIRMFLAYFFLNVFTLLNLLWLF